MTSTGGAALDTQVWTFHTTAADTVTESLFGNQTPAEVSSSDNSPVELGTVFTPTHPGIVSGVRFYKGTGNDGTHTGSLWSIDGTRLATVTFTGESASGWQTATFSSRWRSRPARRTSSATWRRRGATPTRRASSPSR